MKKIYLVIAGTFLILLIITSMLLSLGKKSTTTQKNSLFPTSFPLQGSIDQQANTQQNNQQPSSNVNSSNTVSQTGNGNGQNLSDFPQVNQQTSQLSPSESGGSSNTTSQTGNVDSIDIATIAPVETEDFRLQFSTQLNKIVVEKKTPQAEQKFTDWANQNNYPQLIGNTDKVLLTDPGQTPHNFNLILDIFSIFMNFGRGAGSSTTNSIDLNSLVPSSITPVPSSLLIPNPQALTTSFTYFAQCGDLGSLPLPNGCTLCNAGCGPTTVAMIAASYLGSNYNPKTIVDIYKSKGYLLGCDGSNYSDAKQLLQDFGLKTTPYIIRNGYGNGQTASQLAAEFKNTLNGGWTIFTLADFKPNGLGGHFFWITDIDSQGNFWAYDPFYGRFQAPPLNENARYPYPKYRIAFGVKK